MSASDLRHRLDALRARDEIAPALLDDFGAFVEGAAEDALFRMSPLRWAGARGTTCMSPASSGGRCDDTDPR